MICRLRSRNKRGRRTLVSGRIQITLASGLRKSKPRGTCILRESRETTVPWAPLTVMRWFGSGSGRTMSTSG
jgi:hypothetical protein